MTHGIKIRIEAEGAVKITAPLRVFERAGILTLSSTDKKGTATLSPDDPVATLAALIEAAHATPHESATPRRRRAKGDGKTDDDKASDGKATGDDKAAGDGSNQAGDGSNQAGDGSNEAPPPGPPEPPVPPALKVG